VTETLEHLAIVRLEVQLNFILQVKIVRLLNLLCHLTDVFIGNSQNK